MVDFLYKSSANKLFNFDECIRCEHRVAVQTGHRVIFDNVVLIDDVWSSDTCSGELGTLLVRLEHSTENYSCTIIQQFELNADVIDKHNTVGQNLKEVLTINPCQLHKHQPRNINSSSMNYQ